ncbi:hypothetical protein DDZ18_08805 [Marinicauda salina]|uniref:ABC transporter substrate-binding protein n=1 Tax=Marinicauda salina TaxID=2135793 RepID=A0A2U2BUQ7_9PROT|nr:ABC transporter substrate-binding protein [Marinicauda salina]PWE17743.1 hypothetical protein DDZ18_08805 [Marinicauda salina]
MMTLARILPAACLALIAFATPASAADAAEAEAFVEENAQAVIDVLEEFHQGDRSLAAVKQDFRGRVDELADVDRISNFVLGRWRRMADEADLREFRETFREFAIGVYETELTNYAGQTLEVTGSVTRGPGDYIVRSEVSGGPAGETYDVNWRVLENTDGELRVVDVQVQDIWLAQTQREQITSIIGNNRGDVSAATEQLRRRIAERDGSESAYASAE